MNAEDVEPFDKCAQGRFLGRTWPTKRNIILFRYSWSFDFQVKVSRLLALNAAKRTVGSPLLCKAVLDDADGELATPIRKHSNARYRSHPGHMRSSRRTLIKSSRLIPVVYLTNAMAAHPPPT